MVGASRPKIIWFDLWKTLVTSHCREPVYTLQALLKHQLAAGREFGVEPDDAFLRYCLTTNNPDPISFLGNVADTFGIDAVDSEVVPLFTQVLRSEYGCTAVFGDVAETLERLEAAGYELGVISNLWPFPEDYIFRQVTVGQRTLGSFFKHRIYSFEVGFRKPEPEIFLEACRVAGVQPEECLMVGDNLKADIMGALNVGMPAALIDRAFDHPEGDVGQLGVPHMRSLKELLPLLTN